MVPANIPSLETLKEYRFFQEFSPQEIETLFNYCNLIEITERSILYNQGDAADVVYITLFGAVQQVVGYEDINTKIAVRGPGEGVGQIAFLHGQIRNLGGSVQSI